MCSLLHDQTQKMMGDPSPVPMGLRVCGSGIATAVPPSSILLWISFQQSAWGVSHNKLDGVGGTHFLWGCGSDFIATICIFALIINISLLGMGACITTAVPLSSTTKPKYMEGVTSDSGIATAVPPSPSQGSIIPLCTVALGFQQGIRGKVHPAPVTVKCNSGLHCNHCVLSPLYFQQVQCVVGAPYSGDCLSNMPT